MHSPTATPQMTICRFKSNMAVGWMINSKDLFPYLKVPLDVKCLGMKFAPNCRRFTTPNVSCRCCARILYLLRVCFDSKVNIWPSKHHIQHISVALGLFSILFSPTDQKQKPSRAGSTMETSRCTTGLLCFHSSNRP